MISNLRFSKYRDKYDEWEELYRNGMSCAKISEIYRCAPATVWLYIGKTDLMRTVISANELHYNKKYENYDDYFDSIDSEDKAYFIGLVLADGTICKQIGQMRFKVSLQEPDGYMIDILALAIGRNTSTYINGYGKPQKSVAARSNHICNTLMNYGITQNKSKDNHIANVFNHIPDNLMRHFMRGMIDGDGWIGLRRRTDRQPGYRYTIGICGNYNDMIAIRNIFYNIGCTLHIVRQMKSIHSVQWCARDDVIRIIRYLYDDATIYLQRKKDKADEILAMYDNKGGGII